MSPKRKAKNIKRARALPARLFEQHAFWIGDDAASAQLIECLVLHYGVNPPFGLFLEDGPMSRSRAERWAHLALCLAGDLYPAFERRPLARKGGRPALKRFINWFSPYPNADEARLVQLVDAISAELQHREVPSRNEDVLKEVVKRFSGKYPRWKYNGLETASSLKRHGWEKIPAHIKEHPETYLPPDGSEPLDAPGGRPYLPRVPLRRTARPTNTSR